MEPGQEPRKEGFRYGVWRPCQSTRTRAEIAQIMCRRQWRGTEHGGSGLCILLSDGYLFPFHSYLTFSKDIWKANLGTVPHQVGESGGSGKSPLGSLGSKQS